MKALGHGLGEIDPLDVEVVSIEGQPPSLHLRGSAASMATAIGIREFRVSYSHEPNYAVAFVIALLAMPTAEAATACEAETKRGGRSSRWHN